MTPTLTGAQTTGLALVVLGALFAAGWVVRDHVRPLNRLHIPASVVAGFLVLLLGPQVFGAVTGTGGLFPESLLAVWRVLPGLLINVVFGAIMIGKSLPSTRHLWHAAAPHALFGSFRSFGQFALGGLVVLLLLRPVFGVSSEAGALLEMSFAGGHGTIAGMGQLLAEAGSPELVDVGLGLATISMITGIVAGTALVRWAVKNPRISVSRETAPSSSEDADVDGAHLAPVDEPATPAPGIHAMSSAASREPGWSFGAWRSWARPWRTGCCPGWLSRRCWAFPSSSAPRSAPPP